MVADQVSLRDAVRRELALTDPARRRGVGVRPDQLPEARSPDLAYLAIDAVEVATPGRRFSSCVRRLLVSCRGEANAVGRCGGRGVRGMLGGRVIDGSAGWHLELCGSAEALFGQRNI